MKTQMEIFKEEFYGCVRCFLMYCEDNLDDDGNLEEVTVVDSIKCFAKNVMMAYKISKGECKGDEGPFEDCAEFYNAGSGYPFSQDSWIEFTGADLINWIEEMDCQRE